MTTLNVSTTPNYRLAVDDVQYTLFERHTVDPTKAPGYKAEDHEVPPAPREVWRSMAKYYPLNNGGLFAAIQYVSIREANRNLADRADVTIADLIAEYKAELARLNTLIEGAV